jgi:hypothetical protein
MFYNIAKLFTSIFVIVIINVTPAQRPNAAKLILNGAADDVKCTVLAFSLVFVQEVSPIETIPSRRTATAHPEFCNNFRPSL